MQKMEDFSPTGKIKQERHSPVMDPVKDIVDEWIKEDLKKKESFVEQLKEYGNNLKEEFEFKGSDRTVRNYVSNRKKELLNESIKPHYH